MHGITVFLKQEPKKESNRKKTIYSNDSLKERENKKDVKRIKASNYNDELGRKNLNNSDEKQWVTASYIVFSEWLLNCFYSQSTGENSNYKKEFEVGKHLAAEKHFVGAVKCFRNSLVMLEDKLGDKYAPYRILVLIEVSRVLEKVKATNNWGK